MIGYDFAFGWRLLQDFTAPLKNRGDRSCKSSGRLSAPLTSAPTSPSSSATSMPSTRSSQGQTRCALPNSTKIAGLKARLPLIGGGTFTDEHVLRTMGDEVLGVITAASLLGGAHDSWNQKFARTYEESSSRFPRTTLRAPMWPGSSSSERWKASAETPRVSSGW